MTVRRSVLLFSVIAFTATIAVYAYMSSPSSRERGFHFIYEVSVPPIHEISSSIRLWIPLPESSSHQTISNLSIESPIEFSIHKEPVYGNTMVHLSTNSPLPSGLDLTISFDVIRREQWAVPASLTPEEQKLFLAPKSKVPRDNRFTEIAQKVTSSDRSTLENGRLLYNHILDRMTYDKSGTGWGLGDAIYACDIGKGNCTDFHSFFNAVARTAGIPARFLIGFPIPDSDSGVITGYHCWAEFYVPDRGWVPVDISEADKHPEKENYYFGAIDPSRVLFTVGRDIDLVPPADSGPVNFFIYPVLEINRVSSDNYSKNFSYREIDGRTN